MSKRVAIVGAGLSGLTSLKQCLADGLSAVVFEALPYIGGQWQYAIPDPSTGEVMSSIYQGVILNSCRDSTAFSDFPMDPAKYPDYFGHELYVNYLHEYAEFFRLKEHVRLNTRVRGCKQLGDGSWTVSYEEKGKEPVEETFDAIFACTGHMSVPEIPEFEGKDSFKGEFLHSHFYRTPGSFEGKRVVIIGIGSSAVDIACEIAPQAKELHLITRRGGWILPRYVLGKPIEAYDSRVAQTVVPESISTWVQTKLMNFSEGKHPAEIVPEHKILQANPTVRGDFLEKVRVGVIKPHRAGISKITEHGLVTTKGEEIEADVIISCTGYFIEFPYLPEDSYRAKDGQFHNTLDLYELVMSVNCRNLFIMGVLELPGPLAPCVEAQARWATAILTNRIPLPSPAAMRESIAEFRTWQAKNFINSNRHTVSVYYLSYCDRLLQHLKANPTFWRLFGLIFSSGHPFRSLKMLSTVYMDIPTAGQYRLFGHGNCVDLATESVLRIGRGGEKCSQAEMKALNEWAKKLY